MRKVKYKDKDREFEMPSDTFSETFSEKVMLELIKPTKPKSSLIKILDYVKTIPSIARIFGWLGLEVTN